MRLSQSLIVALTAVACSDPGTRLTEAELMDPAACASCHPKHYAEWSGSMHAYAGDDPVFLAMNQRGQEETAGALGDFCVQCHAPMALRLGLTTDGTNLASVPQWAKGVTCYFCHSAVEVTDTHNAPIVLARDGVMRGGLADPVKSPAHASAYSPLLDVDAQTSSPLCGACHDIVTPRGVHLERTFAEWKTSIFASALPRQHLSCGQCHMRPVTDVIADVPGLDVPLRDLGRREHTFAGLDVALTPWPETAAQLEAIDRDLKGVILPRLCVVPLNGGEIQLRLDNVGAGHSVPSGAGQDRRMWAEVIAYDSAGDVLFETGVVPDGVDPEAIGDPNLFGLWDRAFDENDQPAHFFWEVARVESQLLAPAVTVDPNDPRFDHSTTKTWAFPNTAAIARVTARVRVRPLPFALFDELEASGHLAPGYRDLVPTFDLSGSVLEWRPDQADVNRCVQP